MTDFDALIAQYGVDERTYILATNREEIKRRDEIRKQSRSALREAIAEVEDENGKLRKNLSDLCPIADMSVIESLQAEKHALMGELDEYKSRNAEARVAALEAEYEEAMQFILSVNQPHDYDCANYRDEMKPCDCGYQKLVDTYLSKRGHR